MLGPKDSIRLPILAFPGPRSRQGIATATCYPRRVTSPTQELSANLSSPSQAGDAVLDAWTPPGWAPPGAFQMNSSGGNSPDHFKCPWQRSQQASWRFSLIAVIPLCVSLSMLLKMILSRFLISPGQSRLIFLFLPVWCLEPTQRNFSICSLWIMALSNLKVNCL